jgi:predicted Zn-dependent protease
MPRFVARTVPAAALAALLLLTGCATNPVTGQREFSLISPAQEEQIGREGYAAVVNEFGLYDDAELQRYVERVGMKVARASHQPNMQWKFTVVDDASVNAFAMPGGYVYITRGILTHLNSEAELAGVLGHEIGHVTARHSAQRITQQQLAGLGLGLASIFSEGFRRHSQAAQTALGLMFLKYGRDDENEADDLGVRYAVGAAYDPREIPNTYAMLKRVGDRAGQRLPSFLSTHPDPGSREQRTRQLATQAATGKTGLVIAERVHFQQVDGVVYGRDPRQGYFDGGRYYHPSLLFQMSFPQGWQTQDTRSAVMAAPQDQRGVMQLSIAPKNSLTPAGFVAELERAGQITSSQGRSETIGGYQAWVGLVGVQTQSGGQATFRAIWIRKTPDLLFQILGQTAQPGDSYDETIVDAARSFRNLTDPARINVQPARVKVVPAPRGGNFQAIVASMGAQAVGLEETAILNHRSSDQEVRTGELIKIVRRA